jgi:TRAP-type C4-dicarboxylate transport system permease small subunit
MKQKTLLIFNNFEEIIAGTALFITVLLTTLNVLSRYFLKSAITGIEEIVVLCFTWCVFIGASACYKRKMHYGIDLLFIALPPKGKLILSTMINIILLIGTVYATYLSAVLTLNVGTRITAYYRIPYGWVDLPAIIGFAMMTIHTVRFLIADIKKYPEVFRNKKSSLPAEN